jgi:hypothetical protein
MARRRCRFHHYLWHRIRNTWLRLTEGERRAVHDINPEWAPPRPALDAARRPLRDNDSGEDFLFLHRRMIALANEILAGKGDPAYPRVEGWRRVPPPLDADYPVPEFPESELEEVKSADYFSQVVEPWEMRYNDHDYLKSVRLGQLGSDLESTIHCAMHVRWAAPSPVGYRPPNLFEDGISRRWDAPTYDYLGDTYSSHVNPLFWKIHGWVDERVRDWQRAHGRAGDIEWKGTWMGPAAHHAHLDAARRGAPATNDAVAEDMNRIDRILSASAAGGFDGFFRPPARPNHPTMPVPRRRE